MKISFKKARLIARAQRKTLNTFREWLTRFTAGEGDAQAYRELMKKMRYAKAGAHFTRDELNER